jgi:hypothetical protein
MPTSKTTVNIAAVDPEGNPLAHRQVYVSLHAGTQGGEVDDTLVVSPVIVRTDADGEASVTLYPNSAITPAGSYYSLVVDQSTPTVVRTIRVPTSGPVNWTADAIQVDPIELGGIVPSVSTGDPLDVLQIDATGTVAEWAAPSGGSGSGAAVVEAGIIIAANAVNGTGTSFALLAYDPEEASSGIVPAGWSTLGAVDAAATIAFLEGTYPDGVKAFYPATAKVYDLHPDTFTDPWEEVDADLVAVKDYAFGDLVALVHGSTYTVVDADLIANPGGALGLLAGTAKILGPQIKSLEGIVDRPRYVCAVATSNVNLAALGSATFEYGALRFVDGEANPTTECNVWLMGQSTPSQNGHYKVYDDYTYDKFEDPSTFDPPGQGAGLWLVNPGDPHHGAEWRWFDEDPTQNMRAVGGGLTVVGAWVLQHDPTASGGGATSRDWTTFVNAFTTWKDASHAPTATQNSARWFAGFLAADSTSLDRWIEWYVWLDAGTWTLGAFGETGAALGTCTMTLTPAAGGSAITAGTLARYSASTVAAPARADLTGITIPTSGLYVLRSTVTAGGNAVSTNAGQRWSGFQFTRTA